MDLLGLIVDMRLIGKLPKRGRGALCESNYPFTGPSYRAAESTTSLPPSAFIFTVPLYTCLLGLGGMCCIETNGINTPKNGPSVGYWTSWDELLRETRCHTGPTWPVEAPGPTENVSWWRGISPTRHVGPIDWIGWRAEIRAGVRAGCNPTWIGWMACWYEWMFREATSRLPSS